MEPSRFSHPPWYWDWSSQAVGKPVPGFVSTLFHHMYSAPLRSVQTFLQATEQVWQPMHLSRWKTIETCERTSMIDGLLVLEFGELANADRGVAIDAGRPPVVEVVGEL